MFMKNMLLVLLMLLVTPACMAAQE